MNFEDNTEVTNTNSKQIPATALALSVPDSEGEELVVHRERGKECVFLFESLDDAYDCCLMASKALGFMPRISRIVTRNLQFRYARYKPAGLEALDLAVRVEP